MARGTIAVVHPVLIPGGGTEAVTAWMIEALKKEWEVSLITFSKINAETLNRFYGTKLSDDEYSTKRPALPPLLSRTNKFSVLKDHLMMRYCKKVREEFDLFIGSDLMDFGCPGMQYIGLGPDSTMVKVLTRDGRLPIWYYLFKKSFLRLSQLISGFSEEALKQNISLANSTRTGKVIEETYGIRNYQVIYPPVGGSSSTIPWEMRRDGFLCIARIVPYKRIHEVIDILKGVRDLGFDVSLQIIGRQDDARYFRNINQLQQENASWISMDAGLSREKLVDMIGQYKYGINGALDEHFGISVAEMVKGGCIVFVPSGGGQTEIVGQPELIYDDVEDGVAKITQVLKDNELQSTLLHRLVDQGKIFSTQSFCRSIKSVVHEFFENR